MKHDLTPANLRVCQGNIDGQHVAIARFIIWQERTPYYTPELSFPMSEVQHLTKEQFIQCYGDRFQGLQLVR